MIEQILQADRLLNVDMVEQAREMYGRIVELDPGNAIAIVGLARCALADGDDAGAYELAARALVIDPENDMARRMEARLAEVLAGRGQPVTRPAAAAPGDRDPVRTIVAGSVRASLATADAVAEPRRPGPAKPAAGPSAAASQPPVTTSPPRRSLLDRLRGR